MCGRAARKVGLGLSDADMERLEVVLERLQVNRRGLREERELAREVEGQRGVALAEDEDVVEQRLVLGVVAQFAQLRQHTQVEGEGVATQVAVVEMVADRQRDPDDGRQRRRLLHLRT